MVTIDEEINLLHHGASSAGSSSNSKTSSVGVVVEMRILVKFWHGLSTVCKYMDSFTSLYATHVLVRVEIRSAAAGGGDTELSWDVINSFVSAFWIFWWKMIFMSDKVYSCIKLAAVIWQAKVYPKLAGSELKRNIQVSWKLYPFLLPRIKSLYDSSVPFVPSYILYLHAHLHLLSFRAHSTSTLKWMAHNLLSKTYVKYYACIIILFGYTNIAQPNTTMIQNDMTSRIMIWKKCVLQRNMFAGLRNWADWQNFTSREERLQDTITSYR